MFSWTPIVFTRFVLFFITGILGGIYLPELIAQSYSVILFVLVATIFIVVAWRRHYKSNSFINPGVIGLLALVLAGYVSVFYATESNRDDHFMHDADTIRYYQVVVISQPQEKEKSWKIEVKVLGVKHQDSVWKQRTGNVLLYLSKEAFSNSFQYGDVLLVEGKPQVLSEPANPGEFDYKRFLTFRNIYHQHFLRDGDVHQLGHEPPNKIIDYSIRARQAAEAVLKKYVNGKQEQTIASALVLGVTDGLDNDLIGAYAATGSLHVLSVSGLHVGIIYWLILLFLKPLNKTKSGKWTLAIISLLLLWGYAFITGLSPSVLRAVTMFSFVAIAKPWSQRTNIYNTLAASAFCLLLFEPYLIMSVGFQLSYLAVLGIVYLQPALSRLWEPRQRIWESVWQITCVSIAAQLATFALGLLYFHQFPVYFLFSNLFVIPVSFVVLVGGIALIAFNFIYPLAIAIGFILEWSIKILNYGVFGMEALPYSLIDHVYISTLQCWLLMAALIAIIILVQYKKFRYAVVATSLIVFFSFLEWNHFQETILQQKLTVYKVGGQSAWDIIDRGQAYFFSDSLLASDRDKIRFHIRPNRLQSGVKSVSSGNELNMTRDFQGCKLILWKGKYILQVYDKDFSYPESTDVDFIILGKNAIRSLADISSLKFKKLILDSSNSFYFADRILKEALAASVSVHSVPHQGSFTIKLENE